MSVGFKLVSLDLKKNKKKLTSAGAALSNMRRSFCGLTLVKKMSKA